MGFSETVSEGAAMRASNPFAVENGEQYGLALSDGQTSATASISDWIPDFLKGKASEPGNCQPSPLYDRALSTARQLYYDQALASKLNDYKNKFNCQIKTDEDAVKFANEALHVIGDPYTRVLNKAQADELKASIKGDNQVTGIGISLGIGMKKNDETGGVSYPVVGAVFPGTPAERAGLKPGDIILQVGGESTKDLPMEKVQTMVRGAEGSRVHLKIDRDGKMMDIYAERVKMEVPATLERNFGDVEYIKLINFMNDKTDESLKRAILTHPTARAFIVDLRGNPGGRVEEMVETIGLLMKAGTIFSEETRTEQGAIKKTVELTEHGVKQKIEGSFISPTLERNRYLLNGRPLVVLVDEFSASASELLAAALKDNGRAVLVGAKTFGKGVGQQILSIENGAMVAVTNTRFTNPGGTWAGDGNERRVGIEPNIAVAAGKGTIPLSSSDKQFERALAEARRMAGIEGVAPAPAAVENPALPVTPRLKTFEPTIPFYKRREELEELRKRQQQQNDPSGQPGPGVRKPYGG
ncbi:MAG: PDZ domain-containing protein [Candidatus Melainabacteria bacterium]|nr:PDZ domain-containing protein [Candidatus Melainabacteria bacterium]